MALEEATESKPDPDDVSLGLVGLAEMVDLGKEGDRRPELLELLFPEPGGKREEFSLAKVLIVAGIPVPGAIVAGPIDDVFRHMGTKASALQKDVQIPPVLSSREFVDVSGVALNLDAIVASKANPDEEELSKGRIV